jgi:hypothetical protein
MSWEDSRVTAFCECLRNPIGILKKTGTIMKGFVLIRPSRHSTRRLPFSEHLMLTHGVLMKSLSRTIMARYLEICTNACRGDSVNVGSLLSTDCFPDSVKKLVGPDHNRTCRPTWAVLPDGPGNQMRQRGGSNGPPRWIGPPLAQVIIRPVASPACTQRPRPAHARRRAPAYHVRPYTRCSHLLA